MKFEINAEQLEQLIEEKCKMKADERDAIVEKVAQKASDNIQNQIPIDEGITESYWIPSSVRSYVDQSWETVSFHPKKFGDVGSKKKGWKERTPANSGWGWGGQLSCFDPRNTKSYLWLPKAIRKEKPKVKKQLKNEVEKYYKK